MSTGILDNDLYKFTMQQAVLELYPDAQVEYRFHNRGTAPLPPGVAGEVERMVTGTVGKFKMTDAEADYLRSIPFFKPQYVEYLRNYRFDPREVEVVHDGDLQIVVRGPWCRAILWEVPLLALVCEACHNLAWDGRDEDLVKEAVRKARAKGQRMELAGASYADFGTRRRRCHMAHSAVLGELKSFGTLAGTSNVSFARSMGLKPIGTMAHEWVMGVSALESLRHANRYALRQWMRVYQASLGIALTDTFGTKAFWEDFDMELSRAYDGVRHDSGDPFEFAQAAIEHYEKQRVDPRGKTIIFSDGLTIDKAIALQEAYKDTFKVSFGIGTHLTNDFDDCIPLSIVMKLRSVNGIPVVKLSDEPGKETGDPEAIRVAKWTFGRE